MEQVNELIEEVKHGGSVYAIIIRSRFDKPGIHFFTPPEFSQQLGYMRHPEGKKIDPHFHNEVQRNVVYTQEVLFVRKGKLRVNFYDEKKKFVSDKVLGTGDVILLSAGGHGFEMLEETEMIEVKQGPYCGDQDKTRFNPL